MAGKPTSHSVPTRRARCSAASLRPFARLRCIAVFSGMRSSGSCCGCGRGPIDWQVDGAAFRLRLEGNGTDIGLLLKPDFDGTEIAFLAEAAKDGVFVDVGANIGAYTMLVAAAAGRCRVLAIEPLATLAAQLRTNVALNGFREVTVMEHAVGEVEGRSR